MLVPANNGQLAVLGERRQGTERDGTEEERIEKSGRVVEEMQPQLVSRILTPHAESAL